MNTAFNRRTFVGLAATPALATRTRAADVPPRDLTMRLSDGRRLGCRLYGNTNDFPVLYFHGTPGSRYEAEFVLQAARNQRVFAIAVDRPGMGLSSFSVCHSVRSWPSDIIELVNLLRAQFSIGTLCILATSGGTAFSLACAEQLPLAVKAVALLSPRTPGAPGVPLSQVDMKILQAAKAPKFAKWYLSRQFSLARRGSVRAGEKQFDMFSDIDQQFAERHANLFRRIMTEASRCGVKGVLHDMKQLVWPWGICLGQVTAPIGLWHATCDFSAKRETVCFLQDQISNMATTIMPGHGHFTLITAAAERAITWLKQFA